MDLTRRRFRASVVKVVAAFTQLAGCAEEHHGEVVVQPSHESDADVSADAAPACITPGCVPALRDASMGGQIGPGGGATEPTTVPERGLDAGFDAACPVELPAYGSACPESGRSCSYQRSTPCGPIGVTAACSAGRWQVPDERTCNPPLSCPDAAPDERSSCPWGVSGSCIYGSCDAGVELTYQCASGVWFVTKRCGTTSCPITRPVEGTACDFVGGGCTYEACATDDSVSASCDGARWRLFRYSCNPPPRDAGN